MNYFWVKFREQCPFLWRWPLCSNNCEQGSWLAVTCPLLAVTCPLPRTTFQLYLYSWSILFQAPVRGLWRAIPATYHLYVWCVFVVITLFLLLLARLQSRWGKRAAPSVTTEVACLCGLMHSNDGLLLLLVQEAANSQQTTEAQLDRQQAICTGLCEEKETDFVPGIPAAKCSRTWPLRSSRTRDLRSRIRQFGFKGHLLWPWVLMVSRCQVYTGLKRGSKWRYLECAG